MCKGRRATVERNYLKEKGTGIGPKDAEGGSEVDVKEGNKREGGSEGMEWITA